MGALAVIGELILRFILGTVVLWICSFTVKTENANFKTAVVYNGIITILEGVLFGVALIFLHTESCSAGGILIIFTILTLIVSFWLLMRMYNITFLSTLWLGIAMWAVDAGIEKLFALLFE